MIEGFLRGRGQPPAPASDVDIEVPQTQARSQLNWTVVWIISGTLMIVAGFGIRYYLYHRSFSITGEILYKPEVAAQDGTLDAATDVNPAEGAEVIVYAHPSVSFELMQKYYFSVNRPFPFDPRQSPNFENLSPDAQQNSMKEWQDRASNWNFRLFDSEQVVDHAIRSEELARTYTDATGQFSLKLKPRTYSLFASSHAPSFLMEYDGKLSPTTTYVFWQEQLKVPGETKFVFAEPACSPT